MKNVIRRVFLVLLAVVLVTSSSTICFSENLMSLEKVLYFNDGESTDTLYGEGLRSLSVVRDSKGERGDYLRFGRSSQILQIIKDVYDGKNETTEWGKAQLSFDICAKQKDRFIIAELKDTNNYAFATFFMNGLGDMAYQMDSTWPTATYSPSCKRPYEVDRWYNIKMLFDFYDRTITYYLDNEYWGTANIHQAQSFDVNNGAEVKSFNFNIMTNYTIKGGAVTDDDGNGEFLLDNIKYSIPYSQDAEIKLGCDTYGNIFCKGETEFKQDIINSSLYDKEYKLKIV